MADDKIQPNVNDRPEQARPGHAKPKEDEEQTRQHQSGSPAQPAQRTAPGRRPLFRN